MTSWGLSRGWRTAFDLLRQIAHGTETDPGARLAELQRRRTEIDLEVARVEAGEVAMLDSTAVRDHYQQFAVNARALLADFREVEANQRQEEFADLLARAHVLEGIGEPDPRMRRIHHDWLDAGERTQATVRLLSE